MSHLHVSLVEIDLQFVSGSLAELVLTLATQYKWAKNDAHHPIILTLSSMYSAWL